MENYWKSLDELRGNEVIEEPSVSKSKNGVSLFDLLEKKNNASRRDFLKFFGFSLTSAALAASCERPVQKAIPYVIKPEEVITGKANYYASTFYDGNEYASILIKVRDGRPIKIEGNELSPITKGGTSANIQASLLNLYDDSRKKYPTIDGEKTSWEEIDSQIIKKLEELKTSGEKVVFLSSTIISPSTKQLINEFLGSFPNTEHVQYDVGSFSGMLEASEQSFGKRVTPSYRFDKTNTIVSLGADFLGTWLSPVEFTKQYAQTRKVGHDKKELSKHIHFEAGMSLTGSNADERIKVNPSQFGALAASIYNGIASKLGHQTFNAPSCEIDVSHVVEELLHQKGKSLVVCGVNDTSIQAIVNGINEMLGSYGNTIELNKVSNLKQGDDKALVSLIEQLEKGQVKGLFVFDVNPSYDIPEAERFNNALKNVDLTVSFSSTTEEIAEHVQFVCPDNHFLESWNDAEPETGSFSLTQPGIHPIFKTRQMQESLLKWSGSEQTYLDYIKSYWENNIYNQVSATSSFRDFWNKSLHDGVVVLPNSKIILSYNPDNFGSAFSNIESPRNEEVVFELVESVAIRTGKNINNPWLQEMPDPVTKATWDNYIMISPKFAEDNNLSTGDLLSVNDEITAPVLIQPGQDYHTFSLFVGYGRTVAGKVGKDLGVNAYPLSTFKNGLRNNIAPVEKWSKADGSYEFALTQSHHSMEGRALIRETSIEGYIENPASGNEMHEEIEHHHTTLYKEYEYNGHHWGMAIDLNSCTGCNACLIACGAENNVPVVGKKEVQRVHEMHWIRIDRYYQGDPENPKVLRQPVMCQHCDNAPCENVCPVAATNHSSEGLNQMAYNRCIGTRYCNNNCPYKVRRFNWYDYTTADAIPNNTVDPAGMTVDLTRMVLNPDVTVRAKGVIEKCSFCVQRIQEKKLEAKLENRPLKDGEIKTACQQGCPADAIVFGDLNDENSQVAKMFKDERNYHILEEIHTLPSVGYLTKVTNRKKDSSEEVEKHHNSSSEHHS